MERAEAFEFNLMHFVHVVSHQSCLASDSETLTETELHGRQAIMTLRNAEVVFQSCLSSLLMFMWQARFIITRFYCRCACGLKSLCLVWALVTRITSIITTYCEKSLASTDQGCMKRRGHATHNVYCVCVILLMSQQDMLYLANRPLEEVGHARFTWAYVFYVKTPNLWASTFYLLSSISSFISLV